MPDHAPNEVWIDRVSEGHAYLRLGDKVLATVQDKRLYEPFRIRAQEVLDGARSANDGLLHSDKET